MRYGRLMTMAVVFMSFPFALTALAQQKPNQVQQWEYKTVSSCNLRDRGTDIQQLGEEGWELVSIDANGRLLSYFKRPNGAGPKEVSKQLVQAAPQCSIPLDKAPTIRGLHLGMSADELLSIFAPKNQSKFQVETQAKNAGSSPNYGLATLYPSWAIDEWTAKVSNSFGLPGTNYWEPSSPTLYNDQRTLRCKELEVETSMFSGLTIPVIGAYHTPSLTITDPSYRQVMEQRVKSDREQKQREFVF